MTWPNDPPNVARTWISLWAPRRFLRPTILAISGFVFDVVRFLLFHSLVLQTGGAILRCSSHISDADWVGVWQEARELSFRQLRRGGRGGGRSWGRSSAQRSRNRWWELALSRNLAYQTWTIRFGFNVSFDKEDSFICNNNGGRGGRGSIQVQFDLETTSQEMHLNLT